MPDDIYSLADKFRRAQLRNERAAASEMVRVYGGIWKEIDRQIRDLTKEYYRVVAVNGEAQGQLYRVQRLQVLRSQVEEQLRQAGRFADTTIQAQQWQALQAGADHAHGLMIEAGQGAITQFNTLPANALTHMIGFQQNGSPLLDVLYRYAGEAAKGLGDALIQGLALGYNPTRTARFARKQFGMALWQALRLARTETLRAYRAASHETYRANSDILEGWVWLSARNTRTCGCCWAMDGTFHKLEDTLDDHPNGRCTAIPKIKGMDLPLRTTGVQAFEGLSEVDKLTVLGPSKYVAYREGKIQLSDLVGLKNSKQWGPMRYEKSLVKVLGAEEARKYYPSGPLKVMGYSFFREESFGKIGIVRQVYQVGYSKRGWAYHEELFRKQYMPRFKVRDDIEWTVGLWGTPEPSFNARLKGSYLNVIHMSKQWGKDFNQDAMALLIPSKGAKGGVLSWDFGRHLSLDEMDRLLGGLMKVNEVLTPEDVFDFIGLTVRDRSRVELWVRNDAQHKTGIALINRALSQAGFDSLGASWKGGYEFVLLGKSDY